MKKTVLCIICLWVVLVLGFVAFQEINIKTGTQVLLKTIPVDPRDFLRGDYVVLDYEAAHFEKTDYMNIGEKVYVVLNIDENNIASVDEILRSAPKDRLYLKGKIKDRRYRYQSRTNNYSVDFGISNYYVKEGTGRELERKMRDGGFVKVSVGKTGIAKIKGLEK